MKTLKSNKILKGTGLMTGLESEVELIPSDKKGIRFIADGDTTIEAILDNVVSSEHCVVLANLKNGSKVSLVEHFMASCAIKGIDALDVKVKFPIDSKKSPLGAEIPIFDGSAKVWCDEFDKIGYYGETESVPPLKEPVYYTKGKSSIVILPSDEENLKVTYCVNYNHPDLKNRWVSLNDNLDEIIEARTFGYLKDLETFQKMGYSKGVTKENTVGLIEDGTYTTDLRSEFESAKHKILDILGDLYLTGLNPFNLKINVIVKEAGHALHIETAKILKNVHKENN